jgi:hypothetical protein
MSLPGTKFEIEVVVAIALPLAAGTSAPRIRVRFILRDSYERLPDQKVGTKQNGGRRQLGRSFNHDKALISGAVCQYI